MNRDFLSEHDRRQPWFPVLVCGQTVSTTDKYILLPQNNCCVCIRLCRADLAMLLFASDFLFPSLWLPGKGNMLHRKVFV